ncbi:MAG TPA: glycosyltransferase, partial [Verrucomicrobiae bacterium]
MAVVPARNEAETIGRAVAGLVLQDYPGEFSVVVVDDHSDDSTANIARRAAEENRAEARVSIVTASNLPAGWTGKLWAMNEGVSYESLAKPGVMSDHVAKV